MFSFERVLLPLVVLLWCAIATVSGGAPTPAQDTLICGKKRAELDAYFKAWSAAFEKCPIKDVCTNKDHIKQYEDMRDRCMKVKVKKVVGPSLEPVKQMQNALAEFRALMPPIQAHLEEMNKMFAAMDQPLVKDLQYLQQEVYRSVIASGRTEWGLYFSLLEAKKDPKLEGLNETSNIPELLQYAWSLSDDKELQRNVYRTVRKMIESAQDPLHKTIYAIELAHTQNKMVTVREQEIGFQLDLLQSNLTSNSYDLLVEIALRHPEHYEFLAKHLFTIPDGAKLNPAILPIVSSLIRQLATDGQRLQTLNALLKTLTTEDGKLVSDAEYVYPLSKMAYELASYIDTAANQEQQEYLSQLRNIFDTLVAGKSMEYFVKLRPTPIVA
uniref:TRIO salivary gland protein n=1 Tax=Anopheles farauti TaxID=69004 RepID=A0A1Y9HAX4_9DIPT